MTDLLANLEELIVRGGLIMLPILACSVVTLAIILERLIILRGSRLVGGLLFRPIFEHMSRGDFESAKVIAQTVDTPMARIVNAGLTVHHAGPEVMQAAMEEVGRSEVERLNAHIETLGTIASITPLMGLLGTVLGMIDVFQGVVSASDAAGGPVNPAMLANGIWTALLTTAAGLTVAIPTFVGYRTLQGKAERFATLFTQNAIRALRYRYPHAAREVTEAVTGVSAE